MPKKKLILIGGGGHCKSCIDVIEETGVYEILGILDQEENIGKRLLGYPLVGTDADIATYNHSEIEFLITVGQIKSAQLRKKIYQSLIEQSAKLATVISSHAHVSKHVSLGKGTIVMHNSIVNAGSQIGDNCILNSGCIIEHDTVVGSHNHVSTHAVVNGGCSIGDEVFIGSNSTIANHKTICDLVLLGAGSVVVKDIQHPGTYFGNPLRKLD